MKTEELQQLIFDSLGSCSWEYDLVSDRAFYSDQFFDLIGHRPEQQVFDTQWVASNIHPSDLSQWRESFVRAIKGDSKYFDCELRFRKNNNQYIWIHTRGVVSESDEQGRALRVIGQVFDISERMAAKESVSRYRLFLDNIPDALSLKDREGRYLYINRRFEEWLGKPAYKIYGKSADEIFHPDTRTLDQLREHERRIWEQEETISMERQFPLTSDGKFRHAVITKFPVFDENEDILAIGTTNTDVTERFRAQQALTASEQRYRRLFESAPVILAETDWSKGKALIDGLRQQGVENFAQHIAAHPELLRRRSDVLEILTINQEAMRVYGSDSEDSLRVFLDQEIDETQRLALIEDLLAFSAGQRRSLVRTWTRRQGGEAFPFIRVSEIHSQDPGDWSLVLITIRDDSATEAVRLNELRYRQLFESAPAVLGQADFSSARRLIDQLREQGVEDLRQHLIDHPELTSKRSDFMQLVDVNQEALRVYRSPSKESMVRFLNMPLAEEVRLGLIDDLMTFASGETRSTVRAWVACETGEKIPIVRVSELSSSDPGDWSQVLISIRDVSSEESVRMSEIRFRRLFESSPAALYESDWTNGKLLVDRLKQEGVEDIRQHLMANPGLIRRRDDVHTIMNANEDAIAMYLSSGKESHIRFIEGEVTDDQRQALIEVLETFASGKRRSQFRTTTVRENGEVFPIVRNCELISSNRDDWSLVLVSIQDLSIEVETERQLEAYQQELRSLAGKISLAEESERRRISSELHDGTIQNLVLARIHLANLRTTLENEKGGQLADSINDLLETSLAETRSLIFEISPPVLYELGLEPAVEWLAEHYKQRTGVTVGISGDERNAKLSEEMNIVVFQAARELMVNIAKHAQAEKVSINWRHHDDSVVLTIEDDGVGFDSESPQVRLATEGGFGLFAVKERLKLMGADLEIQSSPQGTRVVITAPVDGGQVAAPAAESL